MAFFSYFSYNKSSSHFNIFRRSSSSSRSAFVSWCFFSSFITFSEASSPFVLLFEAPTPFPSYYISPSSQLQQEKTEVLNIHLKHSHTVIILVSVGSALIVIVLILLMAFFMCINFKSKSRRSKNRIEDAEDPIGTGHISILEDIKEMKSSDSTKIHSEGPVYNFSWDEIRRVTSSTVIGEGGFSTVYLAHFNNSTVGAVKVPRHSERLNRLFKQELEILLRVRHKNIVKLIGYSNEQEEESALVFEYVSNGSLHEKIHLNKHSESGDTLPWKTRMTIAYQLAQALEYLHDDCFLQIVHGDIKASNILLDEDNNCKLCDFGFAKMGFSSTIVPSSVNPLMGSPGYMDPHYLRTGIASKKNDVYSFGVILLELVTGIEAFCPEKEQLLTSIAGPILRDVDKVVETVDARLGKDFSAEEAIVMASISALCLRQQASLRPSMAEVSRTIKEKISSIIA